MRQSRARAVGVAVAAIILLASCSGDSVVLGGGQQGSENEESTSGGDPPRGDSEPPMTLATLTASCEESAAEGQPGRVEVSGDIRDANTQVTISVPCVVDLGSDSDVHLNNVEVESHALNIHDADAEPGDNRVRLQNVMLTGTNAESGLLVELNDAEDEIRVEASDLDYAGGLQLLAAGQRGERNRGGRVSVVTSSIVASSPSATVQIASSEHNGRVRVVDTDIDTEGRVLLLAGDCEARRQGKRLNCSTDAIGDGLQEQADEMREREQRAVEGSDDTGS